MDGGMFIKSMACALAWRDGRDSGVNAMLGILHTVRNRAEHFLVGDWLGAVEFFDDECFTGVYPDIRDPEFQQVLQIVDSVYDGTRQDKLTNGANLYMRFFEGPAGGTLPMFSFPRTAQIGFIHFYNAPITVDRRGIDHAHV